MKLSCRIITNNPCNNLHGSSHHHHHHLVMGSSSSSQSRNKKPKTLKITVGSSWNNNPKGNTNNYIANKSNDIKLSENWKEFQGINNWEGLLDPLHDNLRDEILRYGDFVEGAYRCFDSDASSPSYATCRHPIGSMLSACGLGSSGYRVTKHLHATSGVHLPGWARECMPGWASARTSWIGYVAVCDDPDEISRLGRRDVVVAYRGTATCMEWLENLRASLTRLPSGSMVQSGFLSLYTSSERSGGPFPSLRDSVREEIGRIMREYEGEALSITVVGHSLGAALAMLTARDVEDGPLVTVVSFGGPRVGDENFRRELERKGTKVLRIVNADDPITKVPGFTIDDEEGDRRHVAVMNGLFSKWTQWVYAEIGEELRLSSRDCPHLSNGSVATCHDLKTYLHLVSTNCPLRATAKRVLSSSSRSVQQEKKKLMTMKLETT